MTHIRDVLPGDELVCYMRLGLALMTKVRPRDRLVYRQVPKAPRRARASDLTRFRGTVLFNNAETGVITLMSTRMDTHLTGYSTDDREPSLPVDIHYSAFGRVHRISKFAYEPSETFVGGHPTKREGIGTKRRAYHTREAIELTS